MTHPLDTLNSKEGHSSINECAQVASHVAFFKIGFQLGKPYVCVVKPSNIIKMLRPVAPPVLGRPVLQLYKVLHLRSFPGLVGDGDR